MGDFGLSLNPPDWLRCKKGGFGVSKELKTIVNLDMISRFSFLLLFTFVTLNGQDKAALTVESFEIAGRKGFLCPAVNPAPGRPWLWYAPTLGSLAFGERKMYFDVFLKAGISIAGCDLGEVRGSPASTAKFSQFYEKMVKRGYSPKPILLGQSRGGMMTLAWAFRNPDKVRAWVGIYPVCNLASWPLQRSEAATLADYGMSKEELTARLAEFNPINNLEGLLANRVPMFAVHGDSDVVVPHDLNTMVVKERYDSGGGRMVVKIVPGEGHKVGPAFFECQELIDFVLAQVKVP